MSYYQTRGRTVTGGTDHRDDLLAGLRDCPLVMANLLPASRAAPAWREFAELAPLGHVRKFLELRGLDPHGLSDADLVSAAFNRSLAGTPMASYTSLLADRATIAVRQGYASENLLWRKLCRLSELPDFRPSSRVLLHGAGELQRVPEGGPTPVLETDDEVAVLTASTYSGIVTISRQAVISGDWGEQLAGPFRAGVAAAQTINSALIAKLAANSGTGPVMADAVVMFDAASHANYTASSGGVTAANLSTARAALRRQRDPVSGRWFNIEAKYLVVPPALEQEAREAAVASTVPGQPGLEVLCDAQLETITNGATAWYVAGDPQRCDVFEVGFVGNATGEPLVAERKIPGREVFGVQVALDFALEALDFRGIYRRRGA